MGPQASLVTITVVDGTAATKSNTKEPLLTRAKSTDCAEVLMTTPSAGRRTPRPSRGSPPVFCIFRSRSSPLARRPPWLRRSAQVAVAIDSTVPLPLLLLWQGNYGR